MSGINHLIKMLVETGARSVTVFDSPKQVTRVTRRMYDGKRFARRAIEVLVIIGPPNHAERKFIKKCQKAGESFPIRKPRLRFPAKRT